MNSFLPICDEWLKQEIANVYIQCLNFQGNM